MHRHSLGWRLPVVICGLVVLVLVVVVYAAFREVEATLERGAGERAQQAASQVAGMLGPMTAQTFATFQKISPILREYLEAPTDERLASVRKTLTALTPSPTRRITLWDAAGQRLLDLPAESPGNRTPDTRGVSRPASLPPPGIGPIQAEGDRAFVDAAIAVSPGESDRQTPVGTISLRSVLAVSPPDLFSRLIGSDARILFGNQQGGVWTNLARVVEAPTVDATAAGMQTYRTADGEARIGALSVIQSTPWVVWVEFQRSAMVAGARAFLRRMAIFGLLVAIGAVLLVRWFVIGITTPLTAMTTAAEAIAAGDYSRQVATDRTDEIGRLGRAFNSMSRTVAGELTERQRAHDRVRSAEERMRFALESADVGIWDADYATGVVRCSEIFEAQHGLSPGSFGGTSEALLDCVHVDDRESVRTTVAHAMKTGKDFSLQHRIVRPDGVVRWVNTAGRVHLGPSGEPVRGVGITLDITARHTLEAQYQQAQKMEAVGRLAGGVAHDFNNLLTAILGYCELLLGDLPADDPRRREITEIQQAGTSAAALTRQLLAFSRKQIIAPTLLNMNAVVSGVHSLLKRLIGEDVQIVVVLSREPALVRADRGQLDQIIVNLAVNARDAMPKGGTLTIETSHVELDDDYAATHFSVKPGRYVALSVSDTGVGMSPEVQAHLFEPFFTTKEQGKGTGLGLAMVHGVVTGCGGSVSVYSEIGKGTSFTVYLPRADAAGAMPAKPPVEAVTARSGAAQTVLVVDDADGVRKLVRRILEKQGYTVLSASNAAEALQQFEEQSSIDVLLTDVIMPGASGPELTLDLIARRPALKVIYMSGYTEDAIVQHGVLKSEIAFLHKPFSAQSLGQKVREVLGG